MVVTVETLIDRSVRNMGAVHPKIKEYAVEIIRRAYKQNVFVQISSGYRSFEEQAKLYGQGRSRYTYKGKQYGNIKANVVTNAEPGESIHNYGLAIDFFLVSKDGNDAIWNTYVDLDKDGKRDWLEVADIGKSLGFDWGGDWRSFKDYPHLEYRGGLTLSQIASGKRPSFKPFIPIKLNEKKPAPIVKDEGVKEVAKEVYEKNDSPTKSLRPEFERAVKAGITDGTYPNRPATRAEVAVMINRVLEHLDARIHEIESKL